MNNPESARIVLVTGCSSGFGLDTAVRLGSRGHRVYATMRNLARSAALRHETRGMNVEILRLDVTDAETIKTVVDRIDGESGRLDALVNNAGYGLAGFFTDVTDAELRAQFETNFFGHLEVTRRAIPLLSRSSCAAVVNVSSISGRVALPGVGAYSSSKWALEGMSESLRLELPLLGVNVYLVEPGAFRTDGVGKNAAVAAGARRPDSRYHDIGERLSRLQDMRIRKLPHTIAPVGRTIVKIVEKRPRRFRWVVGKFRSPHYFTRRLLPFAAHEAILRRVLFGRKP